MPEYAVQRTMLPLNEHGKSVHGAKVMVLGLAYKPNVDDVRESPSFGLIRRLLALGADVSYNDPHVPAMHKKRQYPDLPAIQSGTAPPWSLSVKIAFFATFVPSRFKTWLGISCDPKARHAVG